MAIILTSLLFYAYTQKRYATLREQEYRTHRKIIEKFQQEIQTTLSPIAAQSYHDISRQQLRHIFSSVFTKYPMIFRISCLDTEGTWIFGREHSPRHLYSESPNPSETVPMLSDYIHVIQLPIWSNHQKIAILRGEFFIQDSDVFFSKIAQITLWMILIASGLMVLFGVGLIMTQIFRQLSAKQKRMEAYVLSLQQTNEQLRKAHKELYISEKLASLGYLAAGIAHEIGNPLGAVSGYIELLQKNTFPCEKTQDILQRVQRETERIRKIIQELVHFSRPNPLNIETIDLNAIVRKVVSQLPKPKEKTVTFELQLAENPCCAEIDEHKVCNVFSNIAQNSIDAVEVSGIIRISTSQKVRESVETFQSSKVIVVEFSDTGSGIPGEQLSKVFDPFFTTKEVGKGMGLGLSLCHRIVESLHGEISIHSVVGEGTVVTVVFPSAAKTTQAN